MSTKAAAEQIQLLEDEIVELRDQVDSGEITEEIAAELTAKYLAEIEELRAVAHELGPFAGTSASRASDVEASAPRLRVSGRVLVGSALVGAAIVVIGWFAVTSLQDDAATGAEGVVSDVIAGEGVDLSTISNEQMEEVVAANPDVIGMRLALARRYFNEGAFDRALDHYFEILDREQNPEALANVGWMTYLSNHPDVALGYLEAALQRNPDYLPAKWFISNVLVDLGRSEEAVTYLVEVISSDETPEEVADLATQLLSQIEAQP